MISCLSLRYSCLCLYSNRIEHLVFQMLLDSNPINFKTARPVVWEKGNVNLTISGTSVASNTCKVVVFLCFFKKWKILGLPFLASKTIMNM